MTDEDFEMFHIILMIYAWKPLLKSNILIENPLIILVIIIHGNFLYLGENILDIFKVWELFKIKCFKEEKEDSFKI